MIGYVIATLVLLVAVEADSEGVKTCTTGVLGELCGGRRCTAEAHYCDTTKSPSRCTCNHGVGEGGLLCGSPDETTTSIINDPKVDTYDEEKIDVPVPCQYLLTHVKTSFTRMGQQASCDVKVYVANRRIKGKQFASGVVVHIKTDGMMIDRNYKFRVDGEASDGEYCFWRQVATGDGGDFGDDLDTEMVAGSEVEFSIENATNRAHIVAAGCGVAVAFRPADNLLGKDQSQLPGVVVKLASDVDVEYKSNDIVVGVNRDAFANGNDFGPEDRPAIDTMIYRAIKSNADQKFKWKSDECSDLDDVFKHCRQNGKEDQDEITDALSFCRFALFRPKFVSCLSDKKHDDKSEAILTLFKDCVNARCKQNSNECQNVKDAIDEHDTCKAELEHHEEEVLNDTCDFD